jgi:uncharacterized PurR-regulated membrane protein YhhQ (DUF165 family)
MGTKVLRTTNGIVFGLSLIGGFILLILGFQGVCVEESSYGTCYEYEASPTMVAYGFTALLISTLLFQLVALFADHIDDSSQKRSEIVTLLRKLNQLP